MIVVSQRRATVFEVTFTICGHEAVVKLVLEKGTEKQTCLIIVSEILKLSTRSVNTVNMDAVGDVTIIWLISPWLLLSPSTVG